METELGKRDKWDDAVRSKLHDLEADVTPDDWTAIAVRLPGGKAISMPFLRRCLAAAIAFLLILSGGYLYFNRTGATIETQADAPVAEPPASAVAADMFLSSSGNDRPVGQATPVALSAPPSSAKRDEVAVQPQATSSAPVSPAQPVEQTPGRLVEQPQLPRIKKDVASPLLAAAAPPTRPFRRRWRFGIVGGSYSAGSNSSAPLFDPVRYTGDKAGNSVVRPAIQPNAFAGCTPLVAKSEIVHKRPLSFGLGVGYALSDRWSLQSGLTYSYLRSDRTTIGKYTGRSGQHLHFIGVPLGANYRIAEWKRLNFYASGRMTGEWNAAGHVRTRYYDSNGAKVHTEKESLRMKPLQWSAHSGTGVSYPLFRFIHAYAEGGVNYYFNNGSNIETFRSDKPFYVSLQAGFRLGF
ncbi:MAG: PorT family protein [Tannerella sp.]|jgi:hypothetical protein|nr:PorT family protein [Tannerella sp.]